MKIPIFNTLYYKKKKNNKTKINIKKLNNLNLKKLIKKNFLLIKILKKLPKKNLYLKQLIVSANDDIC